MKRDGFRCVYCGRTPPEVVLEVDHVVARANGGTDADFNLVASCYDCNRGKMARLLEMVPLVKTEFDLNRERKMAERVRQVEEMLAAVKAEAAEFEKLFDGLWRHWLEFSGSEYATWNIKSYKIDFKAAVEKFLKHLTVEEIFEAIQITGQAVNRNRRDGYFRLGNDANKIRYFAGVCWKKIRDAVPASINQESEDQNVGMVATVGEHH